MHATREPRCGRMAPPACRGQPHSRTGIAFVAGPAVGPVATGKLSPTDLVPLFRGLAGAGPDPPQPAIRAFALKPPS